MGLLHVLPGLLDGVAAELAWERMTCHLRGQFARLEQDVVGNAHLADVVQGPSGPADRCSPGQGMDESGVACQGAGQQCTYPWVRSMWVAGPGSRISARGRGARMATSAGSDRFRPSAWPPRLQGCILVLQAVAGLLWLPAGCAPWPETMMGL